MKKLKAFTLVEVIIVLTTFSLIIVLIVTAVTSYKKYLDLSKLQTIALNFTREGVEVMFQIRDTNWLQHQWSKDKYIFCNDPFSCSSTNLEKFATGYYAIVSTINSGQQSFYATGKMESSSIVSEFYAEFARTLIAEDGDVNEIQNFKIPLATGEEILGQHADFYRFVKVDGIFCKNNRCDQDSDPKELEFCVKTVFLWHDASVGESEICSVLTNFLQ